MRDGRGAMRLGLPAVLSLFLLVCERPLLEENPVVFERVESGTLRGPALTTPKDGAVITSSDRLTLRWLRVAGAASYHAQVASDSQFTSIADSATVDTTFRRTGLLPEGRYYWRVRGNSTSGGRGLWSERRMFLRAAGH